MTFLAPILAPYRFGQLFTGAKSFVDNPFIGSRRLNMWGLHSARVQLAHAMTAQRRKSLANMIDTADREIFDRDGVLEIRDFLPDHVFAELQAQVRAYRGAARETVQGNAITRRIAFDRAARDAIPAFEAFRTNRRWQGLARYVSGFNVEPLLYLQSVLPNRQAGSADPQLKLHADTFYPSMKAWLFLEDVTDDMGPFSYVKESHRLTPARLAWEKARSLSVRDGDCRLSARGSFRVAQDELKGLGLPQPTRFAVPANTLIIADMVGFHARSPATLPATRVELWAYGRRNPFRPVKGLDIWSLPRLADHRVSLRWWLGDQADGLITQPWRPVGIKSAGDP